MLNLSCCSNFKQRRILPFLYNENRIKGTLIIILAIFFLNKYLTISGLAWGTGSSTSNEDTAVDFSFVLLPLVLVLAHFLLYHRVHWVSY